MRIALALGGGAALGWAHIGVARTLVDAGFTITAVAGTSVGAVVGAAIAANRLDELEALARAVNVGTILRYLDPSFRAGGLLGGRTVLRELGRHFGDQHIEDLAIPYSAVAADLVTGAEVRLSQGRLADAVRASIAVPGIFTPVRMNGHILIDGGTVAPVPVGAARALSAAPVVAVNLQSHYPIRAQAYGFSPQGKYPRNAALMVTRAALALTLRTLSELQLHRDEPDILITPEIGHIDAGKFRRAEELIQLGRAAAWAALPNIRAGLEQPQQQPDREPDQQ